MHVLLQRLRYAMAHHLKEASVILNTTSTALLLANYLVFQFGSPFLSSLLVTYVPPLLIASLCRVI